MENLINKIIFGCCEIAKSNLKNKSVKLLNYANEIGITNFDTAPLYSKGYSEILIGEVFKNKNSIFVTTKVGKYSTPNLLIPSNIAIPLNSIIKNRNKKIRNFFYIDNNKNICENHFKTEILKSRKRLKNNIDSVLIHELNPYKIDTKVLNNINCFLSKVGINKFGYGGALHNEFFEKKIPHMFDIVQIPFPVYFDDKYDKIKQLIRKNNHVEFRFFNVFKERHHISERMDQAKKLLLNFSNTKIIFQTSSLKRLRENIDFFTS